MELRQLQYFLATAENGSFSRAASVLGVAQPVLSRQIGRLEDELGARLFYRNGRGIRLTDEGERFHATVGPLIAELRHAKSDLMGRAQVPSGSISLAMPPSMSAVIGARLIRNYLERFPQVKLHVIDGFSGYVNEWLSAGRVDIAVLNDACRPPHVQVDPLLTVDLFHMARRDSANSDGASSGTGDSKTICFSRVAAGPLILPGRHHGLRREIDLAAQKCGLDLNVVVEVDALESLKELVCSNMGATVLPHGAIVKEAADPDVIVRRVTDPNLTMRFVVAYSLAQPVTLAMRELARALRIEVRQAIADGRMMGRP